MRSYELMFVADPRLSDDEVAALAGEYRQMLGDGGGQVVSEESWGKRRLAYTIRNLGEGRYVLFYVEADGANPFPLVEQRLRQNDRILRYLTVRTDRPAPVERAPEGTPVERAEAGGE